MYSRAYSVGASIGVFVYILIFLGGGIIFGLASKHINESKGYSGGFAWGFFLGLIGIIVVACKPNINKQSSYSESSGSDSDYYHRPSQPAYTNAPTMANRLMITSFQPRERAPRNRSG